MTGVRASCRQWTHFQQHSPGALFLEHSLDTAGKPVGQTTSGHDCLLGPRTFPTSPRNTLHTSCESQAWGEWQTSWFLTLAISLHVFKLLICYYFVILQYFPNGVMFKVLEFTFLDYKKYNVLQTKE